jgi:geranylgeranyl reductase family protein
MTYDAIVVGSGPAGSFCAWRLAAGGASVLLLEKARLPRPKVCGGALSRKALQLAGCDLSPIVHNAVRRATITWRGETSAEVVLDDVGACTTVRAEFDAFLARRAEAAGADLRDGTAFQDALDEGDTIAVKTSAGSFRTRHLIGADGVGSQVRKRVFGDTAVRQVPSVEVLLRVSDATLAGFHDRALFDLGGMERGYGWIFPKRDHLNVGIYSPLGGRQMRAQLDAFLQLHEPLRGAEVLSRVGYAIPLFDRRRRIARGRTLLLGDAAGCAEGVYGEGIYFAMTTGRLAAEAIATAPDGEAGARYAAGLKATLGPELTCSNWIGRGYFTFPRFSFRHLAMDPRGQAKFAGIITGEVNYRDCLWSAIRSAPRWLLRGRRA